MKRQFTASLSREDEWIIAQCLAVDVASQGETEEEALLNLKEALQLHVTLPVATALPAVRAIEINVASA